MKCLDYPLTYIRQTGMTLNIRYKQNIEAIININNNLGYSNHILNSGHTWNCNGRHGYYKNRKERKTFKHFRKILHMQN
jgi:hypothetical protein